MGTWVDGAPESGTRWFTAGEWYDIKYSTYATSLSANTIGLQTFDIITAISDDDILVSLTKENLKNFKSITQIRLERLNEILVC